MWIVFNSLIYTCKHTYQHPQESDFKKPGTGWGTWFKKGVGLQWKVRKQVASKLLAITCHPVLYTTIYRETLAKGKFGEFDESSSNRQNKTNQYKATTLSASIFFKFTV